MEERESRAGIWVHYECSEIMSQDGGCHLGVEWSPSVSPGRPPTQWTLVGCWPGRARDISHFTADSRFIWYPCYWLLRLCFLKTRFKAVPSMSKILVWYVCTMYVLCMYYVLVAAVIATCSEYHCSVNCSRPATLNNCPHAAVLQGYAVTYCGAQCVPDSECLCMMSIFEEDILIQTDSSNCSGVSHLTRPPAHQAVIPDKAAHTDLFVLKVLRINQGLSVP